MDLYEMGYSDTKPTTHWDTMGIELDLYRVVMGVSET